MVKSAPIDRAKVAKLWNAGLDRNAIASRLGCAAASVTHILTELGLTTGQPRRRDDWSGTIGNSRGGLIGGQS